MRTIITVMVTTIITGTGTFTKQGAGTLTLSGSNSFTGNTNITADPGVDFHEPETVDTFEIGLKSSFDGPIPGRFNVAIFDNTLTDMQLQGGYVSTTSGPTTAIFNPADPTSYPHAPRRLLGILFSRALLADSRKRPEHHLKENSGYAGFWLAGAASVFTRRFFSVSPPFVFVPTDAALLSAIAHRSPLLMPTDSSPGPSPDAKRARPPRETSSPGAFPVLPQTPKPLAPPAPRRLLQDPERSREGGTALAGGDTISIVPSIAGGVR